MKTTRTRVGGERPRGPVSSRVLRTPEVRSLRSLAPPLELTTQVLPPPTPCSLRSQWTCSDRITPQEEPHGPQPHREQLRAGATGNRDQQEPRSVLRLQPEGGDLCGRGHPGSGGQAHH